MRIVVLLAIIAAWVAAYFRYRAFRRQQSQIESLPTNAEIDTSSPTRTQRFKNAVLTTLGLGPADRRR